MNPPKTINILALGDSLTAGFMLTRQQAFPAQLQLRLKALGYPVRVKNAGVNGDTIAGGLARLPALLKTKPDAVIVELGANDILLKRDPALMARDLRSILTMLKKAGIPVLLAGMYAFPGQGNEYNQRVKQMYRDLAREFGVVLRPFFLEGVAGDAALTFPDGIHPNRDGVIIVVQGILPQARELLKSMGVHPLSPQS